MASDVISTPQECKLISVRGIPLFQLPALGEPMMRIRGSKWVKDQKVWIFPAFNPFIEEVVEDLKIVVPLIEFTDAAKQHIEACAVAREQLEKKKVVYREGFAFVTKPFDHQVDGLNFVLTYPRSGLLYDCGLGKTKIIIDLIRHEHQKTLILAPTTVVRIWEREARIHSGGQLKVVCVDGRTPKQKRKQLEAAAAPNVDIVVIGYHSAKLYFDELTQLGYQIIVADESHNLRTHNSGISKCALALSTRAARRIILSGTPSLGNPLHLFGQLAFLGDFVPGADFWKFRSRYVVVSRYNKHIITGFQNLDMLNTKVQKVALRRSKEECLDLPRQSVIDTTFEATDEQKQIYNQLVEEFSANLADGKVYDAPNAGVVISKLMQILSGFFIVSPPQVCNGCKWVEECVERGIHPYTSRCSEHPLALPRDIQHFKSNPKLDACSDLLDEILAEEKNKVIIWAHFTEELNQVEALLRGKGIGYYRIDGSNSNHAQKWAEDYQRDTSSKRVWLGQISTGVGLTLTRANYMIYYGVNYNLDAYLQSLDRNYRIGQTQPVFVYRLTLEKSVLDFIYMALSQKINIAQTITERVLCATCKNALICLGGTTPIEPFAEGCIHKDRMSRVITKPQTL